MGPMLVNISSSIHQYIMICIYIQRLTGPKLSGFYLILIFKTNKDHVHNMNKVKCKVTKFDRVVIIVFHCGHVKNNIIFVGHLEGQIQLK